MDYVCLGQTCKEFGKPFAGDCPSTCHYCGKDRRMLTQGVQYMIDGWLEHKAYCASKNKVADFVGYCWKVCEHGYDQRKECEICSERDHDQELKDEQVMAND